MKLTDEDKRKLDGEKGQAVQEAMEHLVKLGEAYGAEEMVDLHTCHVFGDYRTIGDGGLEFYEKYADMGAKVIVHSSVEPISVDDRLWPRMKLPSDYPSKQARINDALRRMDVMLDYSCIYYLTMNLMRFGQNTASIEGNATGWLNSVIGARGNREDSITSLLAGFAGRMPKYGLLDPKNRVGQVLVEVEDGLVEKLGGAGRNCADFEALGMVIGDFAYDKIPVVTGLPNSLTNEQLKGIVAMCSPALTTTLILMVGISPEAPTVEAAFGGSIPSGVKKRTVEMKDIKAAYEELTNAERMDINGVFTGCPLKTIYEIQEVGALLKGKRIKDGIFFYVHTDHSTWHLANEMGLVESIEKTGAFVTRNICPFCLPLEYTFGPDVVIATDSMKTSRLLSGEGKPRYIYGTLEDCVNAALTGTFTSTRWS